MPRNGRRTPAAPAASAASAMFLQIASCQMWAGVLVDHGHVLIILHINIFTQTLYVIFSVRYFMHGYLYKNIYRISLIYFVY